MHTITYMVIQKFQIISENKRIGKLKELKGLKLLENQQLKAVYLCLNGSADKNAKGWES